MNEEILVYGPLAQELISGIINEFAGSLVCGGHSIFLGQVRADTVAGKRVAAIEYSAYETMADKAAGEIIQSVLAEFDDVKTVKIVHSVGRVMAGEISLLVAVSAGHRNHAIAGCEKAVELIKSDLPVWKKEIFEDNSVRWLENPVA